MICPQCQKRNQDAANYCPYCGYSFQEVNPNYDKKQIQNNLQSRHDNELIKQQNIQKQVHTKKNFINSLLEFLIQGLINPTRYAKIHGGSQYVYGYMTLGLSSLFYGLAFALANRSFSHPFTFVGIANNYFFLTFFTQFLLTAGLLALTVTFIYIYIRKVMKLNVRFNHVVGRFGTLATVFTMINLVALLVAFSGFVWFYGIISMLVTIVQFYITLTTIHLYSQEAKGAYEPLYGGLIIAAIIIVINSIFSAIVFTNLAF